MMMEYKEYVKDVFIEHQISCGPYSMEVAEAEDTFNDQPFSTIEKWLIKSGYDLENGYKYEGGK
jgi:hypothetical protein